MQEGTGLPLRLMICIPTLGPGGAERQVRTIAPALVRHGMDVAVFARMNAADVNQLENQGVRCFPIECSGNYNPQLLLELLSAIRRHKTQVVQTLLLQMDVVGGIAARVSRRKWILSERASTSNYRPSVKNNLRHWIGAKADAIHANSVAGLEVWPTHPQRQVIGNGIDISAVQNAGKAQFSRHELPLSGPRIVAIGRLSPVKAFHILLRAAVRVQQDLPEFSISIMGEGPSRKTLQNQTDRLGLNDVVHFVGFRSDVWEILGQATIFVATSTSEGHPNAVLEAAAAGIPQILSDIPAHRQAVGDGGALFVRPEDDAALAAAICQLSGDPEGGDVRAARALRHIEQLTPDHTAVQLIKLCRSLKKS